MRSNKRPSNSRRSVRRRTKNRRHATAFRLLNLTALPGYFCAAESCTSCGEKAVAVSLPMNQQVKGKDLTKEAPRNPKVRVGGYVILGRTLDKCRALLAGNIGEYHFDCPLDNMLFGWKGVTGDNFKAEVEMGTDDAGVAKCVDAHGTPKTDAEKESWCTERLAFNFNDVPEKKE